MSKPFQSSSLNFATLSFCLLKSTSYAYSTIITEEGQKKKNQNVTKIGRCDPGDDQQNMTKLTRYNFITFNANKLIAVINSCNSDYKISRTINKSVELFRNYDIINMSIT